MGTIGSRLREWREQLGLNQAAFAAIAGCGRKVQSYYENDERRPDADYLVAVAASGVDVQYVLTGVRSANVAEVRARLGGVAPAPLPLPRGVPVSGGATLSPLVLAVIEAVEELLIERSGAMAPAAKAQLVAMMYALAVQEMERGRLAPGDRAAVVQLVKAAA